MKKPRYVNGQEVPAHLSSIDIRLLSNTWPCTCRKCGGNLGWDNDFTLVESGYLPEDVSEEKDHIVHCFHCSECDSNEEWEDLNNGWHCLLSRSNGEKGGLIYTSRAKSMFNVI